VNPDGTFRIPNISAADEFGPGGPGTRPDFVSDDFVRLTGFSDAGGTTTYCFSEPFEALLSECRVHLADAETVFSSYTMVQVWGRRPVVPA
jgi:hypothetical protein